MISFEDHVAQHLASLPDQLTLLLSERFRQDQVVELHHLVPPAIAEALNKQALRLLEASAKRRDLTLAETGGTPRAYQSVGRDVIRQDNGSITRLFESDAIRDYLSDIAGERLHKVPYAAEEYIVNAQMRAGDTHGWHWDDYSFALIWMVEAPGATQGGRLEFITDTVWDKDDPRACLEHYLTRREVRSRYIEAGTCYLMRANTTLHRVAPLTENGRRAVIVFTYASDADLVDPTISHETMEKIYAAEVAAA